jgi:hypothetical protein
VSSDKTISIPFVLIGKEKFMGIEKMPSSKEYDI